MVGTGESTWGGRGIETAALNELTIQTDAGSVGEWNGSGVRITQWTENV